ncbi:hypothetical protein C7S14_1499 [Burkholderia cepacia]|nr:hypothetical protein C7S14_1499 [Burkholderia cepacia]
MPAVRVGDRGCVVVGERQREQALVLQEKRRANKCCKVSHDRLRMIFRSNGSGALPPYFWDERIS